MVAFHTVCRSKPESDPNTIWQVKRSYVTWYLSSLQKFVELLHQRVSGVILAIWRHWLVEDLTRLSSFCARRHQPQSAQELLLYSASLTVCCQPAMPNFWAVLKKVATAWSLLTWSLWWCKSVHSLPSAVTKSCTQCQLSCRSRQTSTLFRSCAPVCRDFCTANHLLRQSNRCNQSNGDMTVNSQPST